MVSAQTTSLVIATYNWAEALHCSLLSVRKQKILPAEVIIADDGSDDRTKEVVRKMQETFPVPIIHAWHEDLGFRKSQILNKAIGQCAGPYVIQVDGDVLLHTSFVRDHLAAAERGAFIRGTRARLTPAKTDELLGNADTELSFFSKGVYNRLNALRLPVLQSLGQRKEMKSRSVRGSNLAFWKEDFLRVNGYNNELSGWGHEDEELAARFINNNIIKKIVKLGAVQYHLHHEELPRSNESYHREIIQHTLLTKVKRCINGYENLLKSSLIISTYNWPEALRLCLLSVREQSVLPDEVIIADDGSTGQTAEVIEALRPSFPVKLVHVWQEDEGFQLSKIRNKAIATSSCDYIIQIDGDLILHKHFIKDHLALSKRGTFVAGSRVLMDKELSEKMLHGSRARIMPFQSGLGNFTNRFSITWLSRYMADRYKTQDIFALRGCNMAFWREDLLRVNGYNEVFHSWGREDNEIAVRLLNSGLKKRAAKFAGVVFHIYHPEVDRGGCPKNETYLTEALLNKTVYCCQGVHQYLAHAEPVQLAEREFAL